MLDDGRKPGCLTILQKDDFDTANSPVLREPLKSVEQGKATFRLGAVNNEPNDER
jgi:hypothetical protein